MAKLSLEELAALEGLAEPTVPVQSQQVELVDPSGMVTTTVGFPPLPDPTAPVRMNPPEIPVVPTMPLTDNAQLIASNDYRIEEPIVDPTADQEFVPVVTEQEAGTSMTSIEALINSKLLTSDAPKKRKSKNDKQQTNGDGTGVEAGEGGGLTPSGRVRQARRSDKKVDEDRLYDGTQLHAGHHGYFVHRDYAAHFFRWGFVGRRMKPGQRTLDVGCGQDLPLARVISAPNIFKNCQPEEIVCVDWNKISANFNPKWLTVHDEFDFNHQWYGLVGSVTQSDVFIPMERLLFDNIVCLEVIEHMDEHQGDELLKGIYGCLKPGGQAFISTPVFNGLAAANHIHEYGLRELWDKFVANGFTVVERYGTFANIIDLKKVMTESELLLYEQLSTWYSNDILSTFFAPRYPDQSRNNMWVVMRTVDLPTQ